MRSWLYAVARLLGDVNAVRRGPAALARRAVRKAVRREVGKALQRRGL